MCVAERDPGFEGGEAAPVEERGERGLDQLREEIGASAVLDQLPDVVPELVLEQRLGEVVHELDAIGALVEAVLEKSAQQGVKSVLAVSAGVVEEAAAFGGGGEL